MKPRRVYVMLECYTDSPLGHMSSGSAWQGALDRAKNPESKYSVQILQAQANVAQEIPGEIEGRVKEALKAKIKEMG